MELENPKLRSLEQAVDRANRVQSSGGKVVLTNGIFDLLHTGHLYYLRQAAALGDALFIALNSDASTRALKGPERPIMSEEQRAYSLGALEFVDTVLIFREERLTKEIEQLRPDLYTKAGDYTLDTLNQEERKALENCGSEIVFMPFLEGFSTTKLIDRIRKAGEL